MAYFTDHPRARWAVPAGLLAVLTATAYAVAAPASAEPVLPDRTAAQLVVDVSQASLDGLSGTITQSSDLGLPALPGLGSAGSASTTAGALLGGTHTWRVWYAAPDRARIALVSAGGETDLVRNGSELLVWTSTDQSAVHYALPTGPATKATPIPTRSPADPQSVAERLLGALDPSTAVTTERNVVVAGRAAYELVLTPRSGETTVGQVRIAVDGERHVPLRVRVYATGGDKPAAELGFTEVSFEPPDASHFTLTPPPGVTVTEGQLDQMPGGLGQAKGDGARLVGSGWSAVAVLTRPVDTGTTGDQADPNQTATRSGSGMENLIAGLPAVSGTWGSGRLVTSALVNVVLADDGRVAAGLVPPELLYQALGTP